MRITPISIGFQLDIFFPYMKAPKPMEPKMIPPIKFAAVIYPCSSRVFFDKKEAASRIETADGPSLSKKLLFALRCIFFAAWAYRNKAADELHQSSYTDHAIHDLGGGGHNSQESLYQIELENTDKTPVYRTDRG